MTEWNPADARVITARPEVSVVTRRRDGTLRHPITIWVVGVGDRIFVRSTNGRTAGWFRSAARNGSGQLVADGSTHEVTFTGAEPGDLAGVDAAYRSKYGRRYASIVDPLLDAVPRSATLEVHPA